MLSFFIHTWDSLVQTLTQWSAISKPLGFHAHNNKGQAFANSVIAIENKVNFIDSTITGIGKGAGNLDTERIIKGFGDKYNANALLPVKNDLVYSLQI